MLQALLGSASLTPTDVQIVEYPDFGQGAAVQQGAVDAATGFVNNEPVQLNLAGTPVTILAVDGIVPLPGPGLISGTSTLSSKQAAIASFVAATLRAMNDIAANPNKGLDAAIKVVPELANDRVIAGRGPRCDHRRLEGADWLGGHRQHRPGQLAAIDRVHEQHRPGPERGYRRRSRAVRPVAPLRAAAPVTAEWGTIGQ